MSYKCDKCMMPTHLQCTKCYPDPKLMDQIALCKRALTAVRSAYKSHQLYDKFPLPLVEEALSKIKV